MTEIELPQDTQAKIEDDDFQQFTKEKEKWNDLGLQDFQNS